MSQTKRAHIAIVDDDNDMRKMIEDYLIATGYEVHSYISAVEALEKMRRFSVPDVIISDIRMPQIDGLDFAVKVRDFAPDSPLILITGFGSIETAIEGIKRGAFDYITKPFKLAALGLVIDRALSFKNLQKENRVLRTEIKKRRGEFHDLIASSPAMKEVIDVAHRVSQTEANILINGESGTGKELLARSIHNSSSRKIGAFVSINCTSVSHEILENELFGNGQGKIGALLESNRGTLFINEIGSLDLDLQAKLLTAIQDRQVKVPGTQEFKTVDFRIIAATTRDLRQEIRNGHFREDLYFRLSVVPITVPPLRFRHEDIPVLTQHFLEKYAALNSITPKRVSTEAMQKLINMRWDGNIRELENVIERLTVLTKNSVIDVNDIQLQDSSDTEKFFGKAIEDSPTMEILEKRYIQYVLNKTGGRKEKAAQILGINRRTLYRKEREYGLVDIDESLEREVGTETH